MADPRGSAADAAYDHAVAAYEQKSYDVARRWVLEALAQNPQHAQARALLGRLDSVRRPPNPFQAPTSGRPQSPGYGAPETVSTDPTVLISHASRSPTPEPVEPTVLVRRDAMPIPRPPAEPVARPRPSVYDTAPPAEPTMIASAPRPAAPPSAPPPAKRAAKRGGFLQSWLELFKKPSTGAPPRPAASSPRRSGLTPGMRGAGLAIGAVIAAGLLLWAGIAAVRWLWPAGQLLTIAQPTGGTIVGPGIKCGSNGHDCSSSRPTGDPVQLEPQADNGYVFSGFTGDCAPTTGRILMSEPRKCGATFDRIAVAAPATTFALTVMKPVGGTIAGDFDVLCGTLDNACAANVPSGAKVTMHFQADTSFTFQGFTNDCAPSGELVMNGPKTCGGTFMQTTATVANHPVLGPVVPPITHRPSPVAPPAVNPSANPAAGGVTPPPPVTAPVPSAGATTGQTQTGGTRGAPAGPVVDPVSEEQHAKDEIDRVVKRYCSEFETLKTDGIKEIFPLAPVATYREQFRQYKSLKCTITSKPEYDRPPDPNPSGSSGAQLKFGMKHEIQMRSGGAPQIVETIVTMIVSRTDFRHPWVIDSTRAEQKPK
ncbi:MAG TPA: hypothetical protein VGI12_12250 [Vicinamibacterales bacterium]